MALKAVFVGIDRHHSPDVPELGGAKRDATAWLGGFRGEGR